jgi:EmrB/QacA subfamily drug resistance transporter
MPAAGDRGAPAPADRIPPRPGALGREVWVVAGVVIAGAIMSILDTTIVNVALETLSRELDAPLDTIQWVTTGYLLAMAIVIPLTGWLSERFGSQRVHMTSVALFGAGSVLCGLAWSAESLIVFRVLQGLGGGMIMPVGMSLLAQVAGPDRVGRVMAVVGVPMLLGPVIGPVVGGLIVDSASWRWIFYVNVPVVLLALALARRFLTAGHGRADAGRLDWRGLLLLSPGLAGIVLGLSESESHGGFVAPAVLGPLLAGAALVAAFVAHALRTARPLVDVRLFSRPAFAAAAATVFLVGAALFGAMLVLPLYYQVARGETALTAGLLMAPQGVGAALAMPLAGRLTDRVGGGAVACVGLVVATAATLPLAAVSADTGYGALAAVLVVRGVGIACSMMPAMAGAFAALSGPEVPRATAALNAIQRLGGSLGTAVLAVVLQGQVRDVVPAAAGADGSALAQLPRTVPPALADPLAGAFAHTFWWAVAMTAAALLPAAVLAATGRRAAGAPQPAAGTPAQDARAGGERATPAVRPSHRDRRASR